MDMASDMGLRLACLDKVRFILRDNAVEAGG